MSSNRCFPLCLFFISLLGMLAFSPLMERPASAQADTGLISGTIKDPSGAVVPGATVTVTNNATGATRTAQSGGDGAYVIPGLAPGVYSIAVTSSNFAPFNTQAEVTVGAKVTVDAQISVSRQSQTVEVVVAQGGTAVNTQSQELSQVVNTEEMAQLPSLTRNPYDFVEISGNVASGDRTFMNGGDQNTEGRGVDYAINGQRESGTEILMDGVENVRLFDASVGEQIPLDAVQEYRVTTSDFEPQYGRASGGVVNLTTKSGTNALHGSAWEFNRLSAYTANTYENVVTGAPKGEYTRNQFGYTLGGPIKKDKLFFFQSTEWLRVRSAAVLQAYVPTPQFLALTAPSVQDYFKVAGANSFKFVSTVNKSQMAALGATFNPGGAFDTAVSASTPAFGLVNFTVPADAGGDYPQNTYRILGRLDFNAASNTTMFFRYALENLDEFNGTQYASPYPQYNVGESQYNNSALFSINHVFSASLLSSTKISFSRIKFENTYDPSTQNIPELLMNAGPIFIGSTSIQLPGLWAQYAGAGGEPYGGPQNSLQLMEDVTWSKGNHTLRFGAYYNYQQMNIAYGAYAQGIEQLGTDSPSALDGFVTGNLALFQAAVNGQGKLPCLSNASGAPIATPGCTLTLPLTSPSFARSYRYNDWALYAGDSWRLTPRLTVNYALRYEHYGVQHDNHSQLDSNFYYGPNPSTSNPAVNYYERVATGSVQIASQSPVGGFWAPSWGTAAPRIGFAYDVFGDGKTSIRGGWGISYERNFGNITFNAIQNPPAYANVAITAGEPGVPTPLVTASNAGPFSATSGTIPMPNVELRQMDQDMHTAQTQFRSLALEHQLAQNTVVSLEYSGAHGVHLYDVMASNPLGAAQLYLGAPLVGGEFTRPNSQFAGINTRDSEGSSQYNAANFHFQTTDLHKTGLSLVGNYTWSHSTDDLSSTFSDSTGGGSYGFGNLGYLDPIDPRLDWGSSDFDIRQRLVLTAIYQTPWFNSGNDWKRQALGGYTLVPVFTARSGVPFSIFDNTYSANAATAYGIPRYVPSTPVTQWHTGGATLVGPNDFTVLTLPPANSYPFDPNLTSASFPTGISDFGPYPSNMTGRNAFRGPGAWNFDFALTKSFALTERFKLEFRAEGFDIFNHHNLYINALGLVAGNYSGGPITVEALKGGLGSSAIGGNHDERRFGQFALRLLF